MNIIETLAGEFHLNPQQVEHTVELIDEGNTIPFIARYRKEVTGGLSDVTLRDLDERLTYLRNLEDRKEEVIRLIEEQGKLTEELKEKIQEAQVLQRVEDLYKPYKQKKATRASKAKARGLEPLALIFRAQEKEEGSPEDFAAAFVSEEKEVPDAQAAIDGAKDIIAEMISDDPELTAQVREKTQNTGLIVTEAGVYRRNKRRGSGRKNSLRNVLRVPGSHQKNSKSPDSRHQPGRKGKEAESQSFCAGGGHTGAFGKSCNYKRQIHFYRASERDGGRRVQAADGAVC